MARASLYKGGKNMRYTMKNNIMSVEINSNGAEVKSVKIGRASCRERV